MNCIFATLQRHMLTRSFHMKMYSSTTTNVKVKHDKKNAKFFVTLEKGEGLLEYSIENEDIINMYHTGVPTAYRGQGIAKFLVKEALQYAVENSMRIKPTCSYVLKYVTDNPDPAYHIVE